MKKISKIFQVSSWFYFLEYTVCTEHKQKNWLLVVRQAKEDASNALHTAAYVITFTTLVVDYL